MTKTIKAPVSHDWKSLCKRSGVAAEIGNHLVRAAGIEQRGIDFAGAKARHVGFSTIHSRVAKFDVHGDLHETYENSPFIRKMTGRLKSLVESAGPQFRGKESMMPYFSLDESEKGKDKTSILTFKMDHLTSQAQVETLRSAFRKNIHAGFEVIADHTEGDTTDIGLIDKENNLLMRIRFHVELGMFTH